jgi:hypothetical protein
MAYRSPKRTYLAFPFALLPGGIRWMLEHWAEHQEWWHAIPFGWLTITILAFGIGIVVQDLLNEKSALRHNWREWRKIFSVLNIHAAHLEDPERVDILCVLTFRKDVNDVLSVRVVVPLLGRESDVKLVHREEVNVSKNEERRLRLGSIAITKPGDAFARHSVWGEKLGEKDLKGHAIYASRNIIEISLGPQIFRIYAHILDVARKEQSHIYLLSEDELPEFRN